MKLNVILETKNGSFSKARDFLFKNNVIDYTFIKEKILHSESRITLKIFHAYHFLYLYMNMLNLILYE